MNNTENFDRGYRKFRAETIEKRFCNFGENLAIHTYLFELFLHCHVRQLQQVLQLPQLRPQRRPPQQQLLPQCQQQLPSQRQQQQQLPRQRRQQQQQQLPSQLHQQPLRRLLQLPRQQQPPPQVCFTFAKDISLHTRGVTF
ncbi:unnamed protein product [Rotaria socialis]|uniref:Uncharacterized protein n=2 Tax=Rotaria socialis TaxID=392032 RepID=A0A820LC07_9BILA|nr:unnamed protein product [Rotaria socialis]CAF4357200.1 unnamed protein product [Rotaria socialis]